MWLVARLLGHDRAKNGALIEAVNGLVVLRIVLEVCLGLVSKLQYLVMKLVVFILEVLIILRQMVYLNFCGVHLSEIWSHPHFTLHVSQFLILGLHLLPQTVQLLQQIFEILCVRGKALGQLHILLLQVSDLHTHQAVISFPVR